MGLVLLVLASVRLVFVVEGVFNAVWGAPRRRARVSRFIIYVFALVALGLVLGGIGWGLRTIRSSDAGSPLNSPIFGAAVPFLLKAFFLTLIYRYVPNARVRLTPAAVAGATVAIGLELLRAGFGLYVDALMRMNLIAGSHGLRALRDHFALLRVGAHSLRRRADARAPEGELRRDDREPARRARREGDPDAPPDVLAESSPLQDLETNPDASPADTLAILEDLKKGGLIEGNAAAGFPAGDLGPPDHGRAHHRRAVPGPAPRQPARPGSGRHGARAALRSPASREARSAGDDVDPAARAPGHGAHPRT